MNFDFTRNPPRLLALTRCGSVCEPAASCGPSPSCGPGPLPGPSLSSVPSTGCRRVRSRGEERTFFERLQSLKKEELRALVLVVGGFLDQFLGNSYAVSSLYPEDLRPLHDVYFREHYEGKAMRALVEVYAGQGLPVALIGHSWGGDAAVNAVAAKTKAPIDLLLTLDPVSRKGPPVARLSHVKHWLNIHVDYSRATLFSLTNTVARIGGPWQHTAAANVNVACPPDMDHAWALGMFHRYGEAALRQSFAQDR